MSHSNQCECGSCQTKMTTEQDEAQRLRIEVGHKVCFFDDHPAAALLNGVYLCESHAICSACLKPLTQNGLFCRCEKYGYSGHEELLWCSEQCLDHAHPEPLDQDWE